MSDNQTGNIAKGVFFGLVLFFIVLPLSVCTVCTAGVLILTE